MPAQKLRSQHVRSASGQTEAIDSWQVLGFRPSAVTWGVDGLPAKGAAHPDISGIIARGFSVTLMDGDVGSHVDITYSAQTTILHRPEPTSTAPLWFGTSELENVEIPAAYQEDRLDESTGEKVRVWTHRIRLTEETRALFVAEWTLTSPNGAAFAAFAAQFNKVHTIHGMKYLMTAWSLSPRDETEYKVSVGWKQDRGTDAPSVGTPEVILLPGQGLAYWPDTAPTTPGLIREPFHILEPFRPDGSDPLVEPITIYHRRMKEADPNGWRTLPGVPEL